MADRHLFKAMVLINHFIFLLFVSIDQISAFPVLQTKRFTTFLQSTKEKHDAPYSEAAYNPHAASEFYQNRKLQSISRLSQILSRSVGFIASTVIDSKLGKEDETVEKRSEELLELISDLGPTFIKVSLANL